MKRFKRCSFLKKVFKNNGKTDCITSISMVSFSNCVKCMKFYLPVFFLILWVVYVSYEVNLHKYLKFA